MAGTIELKTDRLILRKHVSEDAQVLYENFGKDEKMYEYSGWNPYATRQMAEETVKEFIESYSDDRFYGWAIGLDGKMVGTIGAYDYNPPEEIDQHAAHEDLDNDHRSGSIEIGISVMRKMWKQGIAREALECVLAYLTESEGIGTVKAWCAAGNTGSQKIMEKCGMKMTSVERDALEIGGSKYDKLNYEYTKK